MSLIVENIRYLRKVRGFTQKTFSEALGIKHATLGAYEEGRSSPSDGLIKTMAELLSVSYQDLVSLDLKAVFQVANPQQIPLDTAIKRADYQADLFDIEHNHGPRAEYKNTVSIVRNKDLLNYLRNFRNQDYIAKLPVFQDSLGLNLQNGRIFEIPLNHSYSPGFYTTIRILQNAHLMANDRCLIFTSSLGMLLGTVVQSDHDNIKWLIDNHVEVIQHYEITEIWKIEGYISLTPPKETVQKEEIRTLLKKINNLLA